MLLLLMYWQTLELGWEGRRCHIQFWQGVLWRCATVWCLQLPCSAHCFRFCFFCFLQDLFFKIVKAVSYHYAFIITRLSNSHFPYSGNRCHQWNKWDYNYLWSGIYCFIHIHTVPWLTSWQLYTCFTAHDVYVYPLIFFPQSNACCIATFQFTVDSHNLQSTYDQCLSDQLLTILTFISNLHLHVSRLGRERRIAWR